VRSAIGFFLPFLGETRGLAEGFVAEKRIELNQYPVVLGRVGYDVEGDFRQLDCPGGARSIALVGGWRRS
jgi:hypothetical protein